MFDLLVGIKPVLVIFVMSTCRPMTHMKSRHKAMGQGIASDEKKKQQVRCVCVSARLVSSPAISCNNYSFITVYDEPMPTVALPFSRSMVKVTNSWHSKGLADKKEKISCMCDIVRIVGLFPIEEPECRCWCCWADFCSSSGNRSMVGGSPYVANRKLEEILLRLGWGLVVKTGYDNCLGLVICSNVLYNCGRRHYVFGLLSIPFSRM